MKRRCPSGKAGHASIEAAAFSGKTFSIELNRRGELSEDLYAYRCADCRQWHTTRRSSWDGRENALVYQAPSRELQEWAMGRSASAPPVPAGLCGVGGCVALPGHEGAHTWEV